MAGINEQAFLAMMQRLRTPQPPVGNGWNPAESMGAPPGGTVVQSPAPQSTSAENKVQPAQSTLGKIGQLFIPQTMAGKGGASGG